MVRWLHQLYTAFCLLLLFAGLMGKEWLYAHSLGSDLLIEEYFVILGCLYLLTLMRFLHER